MSSKPTKKPKIINTIQSKFILIVLLTQILVSSLVGLLLYQNSKCILIENAKQETILLLQPISSSTLEKLQSIPKIKDKQQYLDIIFEIQGQVLFSSLKERMPNIKEIYVYTDKQDIHTINKKQLFISPPLKKSLSQKSPSVTFGKESFYVNCPVHVDHLLVGGIILEYSNTQIQKEKTKALLAGICIAIFTFLLNIIIIKIFISLTTNYLQKIITDLEKISQGENILDTNYEYSSLMQTELEPLVSSYLNMKKTISEQIKKLTEEIIKRKKAEKECKINRDSLAIIVDEKTELIKEINLLLKDEIIRKKYTEAKLKNLENILENLLNNTICNGILILSDKGEVIKSNTNLSIGWELPEDVIKNDTEKQLLKYFSYQIVNNKKFLNEYKKCFDKPLELGTFKLKSGKSVLIKYHPLMLDLKVIGKIFAFCFSS